MTVDCLLNLDLKPLPCRHDGMDLHNTEAASQLAEPARSKASRALRAEHAKTEVPTAICTLSPWSADILWIAQVGSCPLKAFCDRFSVFWNSSPSSIFQEPDRNAPSFVNSCETSPVSWLPPTLKKRVAEGSSRLDKAVV